MPANTKPKTLKQGTLSFTSIKRGASATTVGKANIKSIAPSLIVQKPASSEPKEERRPVNVRSVSNGSTISSTTSDDEDDVVLISSESISTIQRGVKRLKTSNGVAKAMSSSVKNNRPYASGNGNESSSEEESEILRGDLSIVEKTHGINKLYKHARILMGDLPPIHAENQTKIHHILRVFDTSFEYGPCVGMTRLERWERADALGLNPPPEIRQILMTEQACKNDEYKQSVFNDDV